MSFSFTTETHGKWILAGEHAVLRGHPALVFPVLDKTLRLDYWDNQEALHAEFTGEHGEETHLLFWSVIEHGLDLLGHSLSELSGHFKIQNTIPMGVGMGVSAALCAAISRWFIWRNFIDEKRLYDFSRQLENLFHSESSGVDIVGVLNKDGIYYRRDGTMLAIEKAWQPQWFLSHSGQVGVTAHCVKQVKELHELHPELAKRIDNDMATSVELARDALIQTETTGLKQLAQAINQAKICFQQWGLVGGKIEQHINLLLQSGALAAKPTGSGDGGFVLSLWTTKPNSLPFELLTI